LLVLTRKKDETIIIGDDIEIFIVDVGDDRVKIGINAPKHVRIMRKELLEQVEKENIESTDNKNPILSELKKLIKE
jgi:carbon storage regulator